MAKSKLEGMTIEEIINRAVIATRQSCAREPKDAFKATEKRLYAFPILKAKIADDYEMIEEIKAYGVRGKSNSITRFMKNSVRLDPEEVKEGLIIDLRASIASNEYEINCILKAIHQIEDDEYQEIIKLKYFEQKTDDEIADLMHCAPRTVRTHKSRLVGRIAVFLYGAGALG